MKEFRVNLPKRLNKVTVFRARKVPEVSAYNFEDFNAPAEDDTEQEAEEEQIPRSQVEQELKNAYDRGFEDGKEVASGMLEREMLKREDWLRNFDNIAAAVHEEYRQATLQLEQTVVALALNLAEHILQHEITQDSSIVLQQARKALGRISQADSVTLRVHPFNLTALQTVESTLVAETPQVRSIKIVADAAVEQGGCILESALGAIDAQVRTQLARLAEELRNAPPVEDEEEDTSGNTAT